MPGGYTASLVLLVIAMLGCTSRRTFAGPDGGAVTDGGRSGARDAVVDAAAEATREALADATSCPRVEAHDPGSIETSWTEILELPIGEGLLDQCSRWAPSRDEVEAFWRPNSLQIRALEASVAQYLAEPCQAHHALALGEYHVQYVGIVVEGKQQIYANFVHDNVYLESASEPSPPQIICDGHDLAWGIVYDVESDSLYGLAINGSLF